MHLKLYLKAIEEPDEYGCFTAEKLRKYNAKKMTNNKAMLVNKIDKTEN